MKNTKLDSIAYQVNMLELGRIHIVEALGKLTIKEGTPTGNSDNNINTKSPTRSNDEKFETPEHTPIPREVPNAPKRKREESPNESPAPQTPTDGLERITLPRNLGRTREQGNYEPPRLAPRNSNQRRRLF